MYTQAVDFHAGVIPPHESLLPVSVQTKRAIRPLEQADRTGRMWGTERTRKGELGGRLS